MTDVHKLPRSRPKPLRFRNPMSKIPVRDIKEFKRTNSAESPVTHHLAVAAKKSPSCPSVSSFKAKLKNVTSRERSRSKSPSWHSKIPRSEIQMSSNKQHNSSKNGEPISKHKKPLPKAISRASNTTNILKLPICYISQEVKHNSFTDIKKTKPKLNAGQLRNEERKKCSRTDLENERSTDRRTKVKPPPVKWKTILRNTKYPEKSNAMKDGNENQSSKGKGNGSTSSKDEKICSSGKKMPSHQKTTEDKLQDGVKDSQAITTDNTSQTEKNKTSTKKSDDGRPKINDHPRNNVTTAGCSGNGADTSSSDTKAECEMSSSQENELSCVVDTDKTFQSIEMDKSEPDCKDLSVDLNLNRDSDNKLNINFTSETKESEQRPIPPEEPKPNKTFFRYVVFAFSFISPKCAGLPEKNINKNE